MAHTVSPARRLAAGFVRRAGSRLVGEPAGGHRRKCGTARRRRRQPDVPMPRIALDAVTAPATTPATRPQSIRVRRPRRDVSPLAAAGRRDRRRRRPARPRPRPRGGSRGAAPPMWRVFGIAVDADGRYTAVVSGGGDVLLLASGHLPDGSTVAEIDARRRRVLDAGRVASRSSLRLPLSAHSAAWSRTCWRPGASRKSRTASRLRPTRSCASIVDAARCGVATTAGCSSASCPPAARGEHVRAPRRRPGPSRAPPAAPRRRPVRRAPCSRVARRAGTGSAGRRSKRWRVSGATGRCSVM